jgi:outer membrane protein assembly factor BamB
VMYAHLSEPPPPLTGRRPGIPAAADAVFARALAKEPADRYSSCRAFADALRGAFGLPAHHAAHETGPQLDHSAEITPPSAIAAGNDAPALTLTHSADLRSSQLVPGSREAAGSGSAGQHRARHARAQAQETSLSALPARLPSRDLKNSPPAREDREVQAAARKPAVPRRAMLGLAAAATAGLAVAGWDLSHRATTAPRHTPARHPPGGTPLWTTTIPDMGIGWGPTVAGDLIYIGGQDWPSRIYAVRVSDGHTLWHQRGAAQGGPWEGNVTVTQTAIYTLTDNGHMDYGVAAYNARTGAASWELPTTTITVGPVSGPAITNGILYLTGNYGELYAFNLSSGRSLWAFPTHGVPQGLAASGGTAYVASSPEGINNNSDGGLYAIHSGRQVWRFTSSSAITEDPKIVGNLICIVTFSGDVYALRADNGQEVWHSNLGAGTAGTLLASGIIYIGDRDGRVHALRVADGKEIWRSPGNIWSPGNNPGFGIAIGNGAVYVSNEYGEVHALRARDGTKIWRVATGASSPALATAQNTVYVGSNNLYAIRATDGKQRWNFPMRTGSLAATPTVVYASALNNNLYALRA